MPTVTVKTIGSAGGRDYSTLQAWEDAAPANLVTSDVVWQGQAYNDSEFFSLGGASFLVISGSTSDATRYKELTVASGQSFQDAGGVRSNPLAYDQSKGVGIRGILLSDYPIKPAEHFCRVNRIQLLLDEGAYTSILMNTGSNINGVIIKDCILDISKADATFGALLMDASSTTDTNKLYNLVIFIRGSAGNGLYMGRGLVKGCTLIRTSDNSAAGIGILGGNDTDAIQSTAIFGFTTPAASIGTFDTTNCKNNATDQASGLPGSGQQYSVTFNGTTPFTQSAVSGHDSRAVASTALAANGFYDGTNVPNDISGTARANPPTIGAWEITAAAAGNLFGLTSLDGLSISGPKQFPRIQ